MPREFVLRTAVPLQNATLIDPAQPLPPRRKPAAPPPAPAPVSPPPPEPKVDEAALRLAAERELLERTRIAEHDLIERTLTALTRNVRDALDQRHQQRDEWRKSAVELGVTLAARLLHDRIVAGDYPIETIVAEMIGQAGQGPVTVTLNPQDATLLQSRLDGKPLVEGEGVVRIALDPGLPRGDCRVESGEGFVLSQLVAQLTDMRSRLLRSLGNAQT